MFPLRNVMVPSVFKGGFCLLALYETNQVSFALLDSVQERQKAPFQLLQLRMNNLLLLFFTSDGTEQMFSVLLQTLYTTVDNELLIQVAVLINP